MAVRDRTEVSSRVLASETLRLTSHRSPVNPDFTHIERIDGRHSKVQSGPSFPEIAAARTANWDVEQDLVHLRPFVRAFARPQDALGKNGASPHKSGRATGTRHGNRGRSQEQLSAGYNGMDLAFVELIARQTKAAAYAKALQTSELLGHIAAVEAQFEMEETSWAEQSGFYAPRVPPQAKRAIPALLATSAITAGLLLSGNLQSHAAQVEMASVVSDRTADASASRNASVSTTVAPVTTAPPVTEAPTTATAPPPPPPPPPPPLPPPPTTAAPVGWATPVPGARLSSVFGNRVNPVTGRYGMHAGVDFAIATGTPIHAVQDGVVTQAGWEAGYGYYTCIKHGDSITTCYGHQSKIKVSVGQVIKRDQVIGLVGNTGNSTGPHLHFEVRLNGNAVNPLPYL